MEAGRPRSAGNHVPEPMILNPSKHDDCQTDNLDFQ